MAKYLIFMSFVGFTLCLMACSDNTNRASSVTTTNDGGTDTGGSNDLFNKPLENYIVDIETLPEYQTFIQPLIQELDQKLPRFSKLLKNSLVNRTWYLVPGQLSLIANHNIALPFLSETEQFALHSEKAVGLSADKRSAYSDDKDRATHILHEMVMAIKVDGNIKRRKISQKDFVTKNEYDEIRSLTYALMRDRGFISAENLEASLKANNFYNSGDTLDLVRLHPYESVAAGEREFESLEDFFAYVDNVRYAKSYKRYGLQEPERKKIEDFCTYEILKSGVMVVTYDQNGQNAKSNSVTFDQAISYKNSNGNVSEKYISKAKIEDDLQTAQMAHLFYFKNELLFIEIYDVKKEATSNDWSAQSLSQSYTMCINRSLQ